MGGGFFTDQGAGRFSTWEKSVNYGLGWHELYLMGLAVPEEEAFAAHFAAVTNGRGRVVEAVPTAKVRRRSARS